MDKKAVTDGTDNIILFPEFENLKNEITKMRVELSMLLMERDELKLVICKNIEAEYMLKLGALEYKVYEKYCAILRLKRKIELIQAKKNRQEKIVIYEIDVILDDEFAEYQEKLNEQIDKMNEALEWKNAEVLSEEEAKEMKKLYRKIVKALHPDLYPDISEEQLTLFNNAVSAYKNGDLETLRIIDEMVGDHTLIVEEGNAISQLKGEKERLEEILKTVRENIASIKTEYPYTMKAILDDEELLKQKKNEFNEMLKEYEELIEIYKIKIEEMLR